MKASLDAVRTIAGKPDMGSLRLVVYADDMPDDVLRGTLEQAGYVCSERGGVGRPGVVIVPGRAG